MERQGVASQTAGREQGAFRPKGRCVMSAIKVTIHGSGTGTCSLTNKSDSDGLTVTFDDGTVKEAFLSWKSFRQLLSLKSAQAVKPEPKPAVLASPNGPPAVLAAK